MTDSAICFGCMINPSFIYRTPMVMDPNRLTVGDPNYIAPDFNPIGSPRDNGLTDAEKEILYLLKEAWQKFTNLGDHISHDLVEYNHAIHLAQQKIAVRVARRVNPDVWNQPLKDE